MLQETTDNFYESTGYRLNNTSQLKLFSILRDLKTNEKLINIFNVYKVNDDMDSSHFYSIHEVGNDEWWDSISYLYYKTSFL